MQVVRYAAGDWGVGELWFDDAVPVWHELPTVARAFPGAGSVVGRAVDARPEDRRAAPRAGSVVGRAVDARPEDRRAAPAAQAGSVVGRAVDARPEDRRAAPAARGAQAPLTITLAEPDARDGDDSVPEVARLVARYFAGKRVSFAGVPIDLDWCTPFQQAVAEALRAVPYGETVTYGELAALAGYPNAQRAAGTFCAQNRLPLLLPCHRVLAAGGLGSYGSLGTGYKRRLLELEGAELRP